MKTLNDIIKDSLSTLVIDDGNSAINYKRTETTNTVNISMSLGELYNIFSENKDEVFNANTFGCITIILADNKEIPLSMYDKGMKVSFLKISAPELVEGNNEILIYLNKSHYKFQSAWQSKLLKIQNNLPEVSSKVWEFHKKEKERAKFDYSGYDNCMKIANIVKHNTELGEVPAINGCMQYQIKQKDSIYQGYLPSVGQMMLLAIYGDLIDYILTYIGTKPLKLFEKSCWTSTERNKQEAYIVYPGAFQESFKINGLSGNGYTCIPIFKKIK